MPEKKGQQSIWERKFSRDAFIKYAPVIATTIPETAIQIAAAVCLSAGQSMWERYLSSATINHETESTRLLPNQLKAKLIQLDTSIITHPQETQNLAKEVTQLAHQYFMQEMGYQNQKLANKFVLQTEIPYRKSLQNINNCTNNAPWLPEQVAVTDQEPGVMYFNLSRIFYFGDSMQDPNPTPAQLLFVTAIHEMHHSYPPNIYPNKPPYMLSTNRRQLVPITYIKGLVAYSPNPDHNRPGQSCFEEFWAPLEEIVVDDSTDRFMQKLGMDKIALYPPGVLQARTVYRQELVNRLFAGNHLPLLRLQQASQPEPFFAAIGQKLGSSPQEEVFRGEDYLKRIFTKVFSTGK